jgi:hypothetical protein
MNFSVDGEWVPAERRPFHATSVSHVSVVTCTTRHFKDLPFNRPLRIVDRDVWDRWRPRRRVLRWTASILLNDEGRVRGRCIEIQWPKTWNKCPVARQTGTAPGWLRVTTTRFAANYRAADRGERVFNAALV